MVQKKIKKKVKLSWQDKVYYAVVGIVVTIFMLTVLYPLIYIVSSSFSSGTAVTTGKVFLWPVDFSLKGYQEIFKNDDILIGYRNTIFYTLAGTFINVCMTLITAYPLSRKDFVGRNFFSFLFSFTMMFSGGIVPSYLLLKNLHMLNTIWSLLIPGAISVYNMLVMKTFMQTSIPTELLEAAQMDGCSDTRYFFSILLPLSKASIAVIALFYAVGHWNAYFNALMYITDRDLVPLQLVLREILVNSKMDMSMVSDPLLMEAKMGMADLLKYSLMVVSTVPILCVYPFVQKYFVQGVMIGSVKG